MSDSRWRDIAGPIIAAVLSDLQGEPDKVIRNALREAYPFGERRYHPYKIWCDEIARQRGLKPTLRTDHLSDPRQTEMF